MKEIRLDRITGDKAIYTTMRSKRPLDKIEVPKDESINLPYSETCPFCKGNEHMVDVVNSQILKDGEWKVKSVDNKFPILDFETEAIFGKHEVIIDTDRHNGSFFDMSDEEFRNMFIMYRDRYSELANEMGIEYCVIFKNFQRSSGASLNHPHSQIVSMSIIPPEIEKEMYMVDSFMREEGKLLHNDVIEEALREQDRLIYEGRYFVVFIPDAARYNGEIRIFARETSDVVNLENLNGDVLDELVYIYRNLFGNIFKKDGFLPFNTLLHSAPKGYEDKFNFHIHIIPRRFNFGGFELSTNLFVCSSSPDSHADKLKFR